MTARQSKCTVCGGEIGINSSICAQCKGTSIGHHRHLNIRSYKDVLLYPVALFITVGLFVLGCWLVTLLEYL